jgi:hypothetical protein
LTAPRTPRRDQAPPLSRKPMTSPRQNRTKRLFFHSPQPNRARQMQLTAVAEPKIDTTQSILHRVRERNIRKQKPIKRGHIFDDDSDEEDENDENTVPPVLLVNTSCNV